MPEVFFVADLHFGHANILRYEPDARPFADVAAHDAELVRRWNARVGADDTVWVLGDFAWSPAAAEQALAVLQGKIRLVLGDHDARWLTPSAQRHSDRLGLDAVEEVHGAVKWRPGVLLTHVPAVPGPKYRINLHGHTHSRPVAPAGVHKPPNHGADAPALAHLCVSVEQTGLAPLSWPEVRARLAELGVEAPA